MVSFYNRAVPSLLPPARGAAASRDLVLEVSEQDAAVTISLRPPGESEGRACLIDPDEGEVLVAALSKAVLLARAKRDRAQRD
jgi:hypothetical protein